MSTPDSPTAEGARDPLTVFGIGGQAPSAPMTRMRQRLGDALVDHRGRLEIPAYAVLVDSVAGAPFVARTPRDRGVVQASLVFATSGVRVEPTGVLTATATLRHDADAFGLTTVDVTGDDGDLVATVVARSARTGRVFDEALLSQISGDGPDEDRWRTVPASLDHCVPPPTIDPVLSGAQIVEAMRDGRLSTGPIAATLTIEPTSDGARFQPAPWMANALGSMHGGVVAASLAQACSWAGQGCTAAGQDHHLADFAVDFFRSPPVDVEELTISTRVVRAGRRVVTVAGELRDAETVLAQASAAVHLS
ncbi:acyl-CoA thioesterase domain-containing protein [Williamsia sp. SKLECPSW1]